MKSSRSLVVACLALSWSLAPAILLAGDAKDDIRAKASELARSATADKTKLTRAELEQRPQVLQKTGGFVDVEAKGTAVVVIEGRKSRGGAVGQFTEVFGRLSRYNVHVETEELRTVDDAVRAAKNLLAKQSAGYAIAVVNDPKGQGLAVFPEERIAVVNALRYQGGNDPLAPEVRVVKELWRALGFVSGIGYAPFKNDVFQPVFSVPELDGLEFQVMQPLNFQKMYTTLALFGIKRSRHIPYRTAVLEGWASAPTNDYQKAIWEQIKADKERGPSKPLTIAPPAKK